MFAALAGHKCFSVNCHLHLETSDFLGGLRPVRHTGQVLVNLFKIISMESRSISIENNVQDK